MVKNNTAPILDVTRSPGAAREPAAARPPRRARKGT
jgi:hypothetical protein